MSIDKENIPSHVAIIMDGNGRWAGSQGQERLFGHRSGVDSVREVVKTATKIGVRYLTIYAFSTENWGRPQQEVDGIMELLSQTIANEAEPLREAGVKLRFIGDRSQLPESVQQSIRKAEQTEVTPERLTLIIALNYSSRSELTHAVQQIAQKVQQGTLKIEQIDQKTIEGYLMTYPTPDPELLIRTSGEIRLSNFLLWQLSYSELYFTDVLWPDFDGNEFLKAIEQYQSRDRRFGLVK